MTNTLFVAKSLPWILASAPAIIALALPSDDFRASGAMTLFAATPASIFVLLFFKRPWQAQTIALRSLGTVGLLLLGIMSIGIVVGGTPSFLKEQFGLFIAVDDYGPRAVVITPDGYVVVGDDAAGNAVVWVSKDAQVWSRVSPSDVLADLRIGDAAYTQFGILMIGQDEKSGQPVALTSTNGIEWLRTASFGPDAIPKALAQSGTNLVLIGDTYQSDSVFWHAKDLNTWVVGEPAPEFDAGKVPADVIFLEGFFLAAKNRKSDAILFTSESGQAWSEVRRFRDAEINSLAGYRDGAIAVGLDRSRRSTAIWVSPDGASWSQLPVTDALKGARMDIILVGDGARLFAFGHSLDDNNVIVWSSGDAIVWERIPVSFGDVIIRDAIFTESGLLAVGVDLRLNTAAFWTSLDGMTLQRVPQGQDKDLFSVR